MMYRISVSTLEKFRRYMKEESSVDTEEALIESIKGLFIGNDKTFFGEAYHKIVEGEHRWLDNKVRVGNFLFTPDQAAPAIEYRASHPLMVHEMKVDKIYETSFFPIQVTGRIDGIEGREVRDVKTKFRAVQWMEYINSSQWKFYLDMLDLEVFWYDLFEIKGFDQLPHSTPIMLPDVKVIYHEPLKCEKYETMQGEITTLLNEFLEYIHNRNLIHFLKPAIKHEAFIF